jgi:uncharacterized protein (UPF0210 family)
MKIRAITAFADIDSQGISAFIEPIAKFMAAATRSFEHAGIAVQSRRLATQPFPHIPGLSDPGSIAMLAQELFQIAKPQGIDYVSLGVVKADDDPVYIDAIPSIFRAAEGVFASVEIASPQHGIDLTRLRRTASAIQQVSEISPDGLTNLYLAALANVKPGSPFFPAAYHPGGPSSFALAIQSADLAVLAFEGARNPEAARQRLTERINAAAQVLTPIAERLATEFGLAFGGLDFSLAPYPDDATSLAGAMERLGVKAGGAGMVGAASLVMNAIEAADFPRCGFSGLMLPVLEDSILGKRVAEGTLQLNDLLLYSAVCGTGLDCIPLPGDTSIDVLAGILLDVAALSLRLDKPLTARLMPLPGKVTGDEVAFPAFEYFVPSRVMPATSGITGGAFGAETSFNIAPRKS